MIDEHLCCDMWSHEVLFDFLMLILRAEGVSSVQSKTKLQNVQYPLGKADRVGDQDVELPAALDDAIIYIKYPFTK